MTLQSLFSPDNIVLKMHGLGNDHVVLQDSGEELTTEMVQRIGSRRRGVGSDGVIAVMPSRTPDAQYRMKFFNSSDGKIAEMCGNGIRCFARYLWETGIEIGGGEMPVDTDAGVKRVEIATYNTKDFQVRVDMGPPILYNPKQVAIEPGSCGLVQVSLPYYEENQKTKVLTGVYISMGNPHFVTFIEKGLAAQFASKFGKAMENNLQLFPQKANIEYVEVNGEHDLTMHVWERGEGITEACGTGACASAVAATLLGYVKNHSTVHLPGGDLRIEWKGEKEDHVYMTGPAATSFEVKGLTKYLINQTS